MYYFFLYFFIAVSALSAVYSVFFDKNRLASNTVFVLSVSGIMVLINAGFIAYLLIFSVIFYFVYRTILPAKERYVIKKDTDGYYHFVLVSSVLGAVLASAAGSTIWQGKVSLNSEINLRNLLLVTGFEYFIFLLLIFAALPVILNIAKQGDDS